ncbi:MHC class I antigen [Labeo rohita]|uniref:MHC class I antigen n=1 Tax=Labeo rohita TaxID=84645 RepID=A0A498L5B1_LABRO|nr:MHC class I antigen [Labeo rohita]
MFARFCVFLLYGTLPSLQAEKHSLYYIYTALSKTVDLPGIYQFTAMGLLDDIQIDYYNNVEQKKIPKQTWMKEKMQEDYWEKGTQSRKSKEQWFNVNVDILMKRMGHNDSDLHVLQWRHGCEVEQQGSELVFSKGISEYGNDGEDFLSFDIKESQWVASVDAARPTKRKWDNVPILNQYTKSYLEKECVDWLRKFKEYGDEELRKASPPDVHVFARKSSDESKLKLSCMATGFYAKDVMMTIRKYCTSLPEYDVESTGIRPNHDGTFQLKKSVEIQEDEKAEYSCFVSHRTFKSIMLTLEKHSLYYIYTVLSKPVDLPGIYQFTAMGLLDDIQIDYYNSVEQKKIPKQTWMKEKMQEDYWEKGTQSRKSKEQWFNVNIDIVMSRMNRSKSDLHVLQWRHGCEVEQQGDEVKFSKGISEYAYDGENFLSFDYKESQWVAPVFEALPTKVKWESVPILIQFTKGYLEKECVDWLNKFREYADYEIRKASSPYVHMFAKKSSDETKLKLSCMATGFYAKDVMMTIRKYCTSLPENETESTGIRPNHDGTFQLKKSVEIQEDEKAEYSCFVSHRTFKSIMLKFGQATESLNAETPAAGRERAGEKSDSSMSVLPEKVIQREKHSLYYIYAALSKTVDLPGIYQFTAMGLLDDIQIDYYNSVEQKKIPKQTWMKEKMQEDYWEKGTKSRKSKEQLFTVNIDIVMSRMNRSKSDLHVLQWRHGCEVEQQGDEVKFSKGISEYAYDGENFLSFDYKESQWIALVDAALPTKIKWDNVPILNQFTKGYLEKECVDWLNKFREYAGEELRHGSTPAVYVFAKRYIKDKSKLKLTCMATGFYPRDVILGIRKSHKSLPEDEVESTGIRPNHDGSYQLRKSVEIKEDEKAEYDCFVSHRALKEPIIITWEKHSLYYIYTVLSKPVDLPGIYQFTAMGLLDDIQIDYYNSVEQKKIPKQTWMKEKMQEDYWEKGTQSRKSKEQWFNVNIDIVMSRMNRSKSVATTHDTERVIIVAVATADESPRAEAVVVSITDETLQAE